MSLQKLTDATYAEGTKEGTVLVDFWAEWCGPCRMVAPILDDISKEMENVKIVKLNVDENQETAMKLGITSIPTLLLYRNGQLVGKQVGLVPKQQLKDFITKNSQ